MDDDTMWGNIFRKEEKHERNIYTVLAHIPIFKDLNRKELRAIERILHRRTYKDNEVIFKEGDPGVGMYIIEKGRVNISLGKKKKLLAVISDGEFFGEIALLSDTPRTAGAVAVHETRMLGFFQPDLFGMLETNPRLGNKILHRLAQMIADRLRFSNLENQQLKLKIGAGRKIRKKKGLIMDLTVGKFLRLLVILFIIAIIIWLVVSLSQIITMMIIAALIAYILDPIASFIEAKGLSRTMSTAIIFVVVLLIIGLGGSFILPGMVDQIFELQKTISGGGENDFIESIEQAITSNLGFLNVEALDIRAKINNLLDLFADELLSIISNIISVISIIVIIPFIVFFLLKDGRDMKKQFIQYIPNRYFEMTLNVLHKIDRQLGDYLRGQFIEAMVVGLLSMLALWLLNVKYFMIIGTFAGLANMIPYVGPVAGAVPAIVVTWLNGGVTTDLVYIVLAFMLVQLIDNIVLQPLVLSRSVNLHPLAIVLAILIGGQLFGLLGMLLAVPAAGIFLVTSSEIIKGIRSYNVIDG